ncbi:hypothetical protein HY450_03110 [Candidatus Pacearchaeota archaeon]|nr:hypothetical protein [Candidatus Pacearchaeota archaeon]
MKLENKRKLVARTLNIGKEKIIFNAGRLSEIKEAITKQDIRDLKNSGAIILKENKGKRKVKKRKTRRRGGSSRKKPTTKKQDYVKLTRKLRAYLKNLKDREIITKEKFRELRKEIRAGNFRSLARMKERISNQ